MKNFFVCFFLFAAVSLSAQQMTVTRFALVDLPKIYMAFFRDSRAVREFEQRSAGVQAEIEKLNREIQDLRSKRADAVLAGNNTEVLRLDGLIYSKSEFLKEYFTVKTAELEDQKKRLFQSGAFLDQVYDEIRRIAESKGLSMVLNLKESVGIVWYSPAIDITDEVIKNLTDKSRR
jgi:outer membrane protein